jgi:hypothetical protein
LHAVEQAGARAGDTTAQSMDKAGSAAGRAGREAMGFARELAAIQKAQIAIQAVERVGGAITDQLRRAAEFTRETAREFIELRNRMQQVAALTNQPNQNQFALGQVQAAARANLKPEEWVKFQEEFQSRAGAYLEGDQQRLNARKPRNIRPRSPSSPRRGASRRRRRPAWAAACSSSRRESRTSRA